jgi:hypothetical protein
MERGLLIIIILRIGYLASFPLSGGQGQAQIGVPK